MDLCSYGVVLTFGQLRKVRPDAFDVEPTNPHRISDRRSSYYERGKLDNAVAALIDFERMYAEMAFRKEAGLPEMECGFSRAELIQGLASDYQYFGVSKGKHEIRELLNSIKSQAKEQARELGGRTP